MGAAISINYKDGQKITAIQKHRLGIVIPDEVGDLWSYVQFREDIGYGELVADATNNILLGTGGSVGIIDAAGDVGTYFLKDTGEFDAEEDEWLRGAVGYVHEGPGQGTGFFVRRRVDDDTLEIEALASKDKIVRGGWPIAVGTTTKYRLHTPGLVIKGPSGGTIQRGVFQGEEAKKGEYGFVKQVGWGMVKVDVSQDPPARGEGLVPAGDGLVRGHSDTFVVSDLHRRVGRYTFDRVSGNTDMVTLAYLSIDNRTLSYSFSDDEHAINKVTIA